MEVELRRTTERRHTVTVLRKGLPPHGLSGPGHDDKMPHDLQHFIVERELARAILASTNEYSHNILVPTSVHIPKPLLAAVDRKARGLKISRNRLIIQALQHEVEEREWSAGFFEQLLEDDPATAQDFQRSMAVVVANRKSKRAPSL